MTITDYPFDAEKLKEQCSVIGLLGIDDDASFFRLGLPAFQHRGQEAVKVFARDTLYVFNSARIFVYVRNYFTSKTLIDTLPGHLSLGQVCYSTAASKHATIPDVQPFLVNFQWAALQLSKIFCAYFSGQYLVAPFNMFNKRFNVKSNFVPDQQGNYKKTLRKNDDMISQLNWKPEDRLSNYIENLEL